MAPAWAAGGEVELSDEAITTSSIDLPLRIPLSIRRLNFAS